MEDKLMHFLEECWQTFLSVIKITLQSRLKLDVPGTFTNRDEVVILANGPSLGKTIEESGEFLKGKTLLAVNYFVSSDVFEKLKPELYVIADPFFWIIPENRERFFVALAKKTTWDLTLFVPARACKNKEWKELLAGNKHIRVCIYNTTPVEGFRGFIHFIYRKGWGMPRPHNVLIPSISLSIRLPFKKIYVAGADHSWLHEITVTDENEVLMNQKHFYDQNTSKAESVKKLDRNSAALCNILYHMYVAFKAYFVLEDFARSENKKIINITPGSYIDAFERKRV